MDIQPSMGLIGPGRPNSEIVLGTSNGATFRNQPFVANIGQNGEILLRAEGELNNFASMLSARKNSEKLSSQNIEALASHTGLPLANVGVSVAATVTIDGREFAILTQRGSNRLMLPSGYVDFKDSKVPEQTLLDKALKELREEVLLAVPGNGAPAGDFLLGTITNRALAILSNQIRLEQTEQSLGLNESQMPQPYKESSSVSYNNDVHFHVDKAVTPPEYLLALDSKRVVSINGTTTSFGFHYDQPCSSGQVVAFLKLHLPEVKYLSLLHAETQPDKEKNESENDPVKKGGWLKEVLHRDGLILAELAADGKLLGDFFRMQYGELIPAHFDPLETRLSEVFRPRVEDVSVPISMGDIKLSEYLATVQFNRH